MALCGICGSEMCCPKCSDPNSCSLYLQLVEQSKRVDAQLKLMDEKLRILEGLNRAKHKIDL